jgi:two-component system, response regulator YesN
MYKLLLVDDNEIVLEGFREKINLAGLGIELAGIATNGADALDLVAKISPDILVTDIKMPKMTGMELIEAIRESNKKIKVVILSGYTDFEYARKAISYNAVEYLLKPILKSDIEGVLGRIVESLKSEEADMLRRMYGPFSETLMSRDKTGYSQIVNRVVEFIERDYAKELLLKDMAKELYISENYLTTLFKKDTGVSFKKYMTGVRMRKAAELLRQPKYKVYEIAALVGYDSEEHFCRVFKETMGVTSKEYRSGMQDSNFVQRNP